MSGAQKRAFGAVCFRKVEIVTDAAYRDQIEQQQRTRPSPNVKGFNQAIDVK
jgi:hypothetical protein